MNFRQILTLGLLSAGQISATAQGGGASVPRTVNLQQAVEMALSRNHDVRLASLKVEEDQHAREQAKSAYFPLIRNDSTFIHVTDTQLIEIPAGSFGTVGSTPVPTHSSIINQGGQTFETSGTGLVQPLTQLFKIKAANDAARAEVEAGRAKAASVKDRIELKVRQLYYGILVAQSQHSALEAKIRASEDLQSERVQQVKYGSTLQADLIESEAQSLEAKQQLLALDLQLSDLRMQFDEVVGLPINSDIVLDPDIPARVPAVPRAECLRLALDENPEIAEARAEVEKSSAGVRAAKREYIPDVEAISRYSYQNNVPFLAHNFGTFGVHLSYDIFDGGKKRATLRVRDAQAAQAKENLARISDQVEVKVQTAYNKLERTQQMLAVSQRLLAARKEARRVSAQGLTQGTYLPSQADAALAQESEAQTLLLQSQLQYAQAQDELKEAIGRTANE